MVGSGPFGHRPAGEFNFARPREKGTLYWEPSPRRVRGILGDQVVVDSRRVMLLHETGHLPKWYFPREDVREELLEASDRTTRCPWKGEASYWSVRVGDRVAADAMWAYPDPLPEAPPLGGYVSFEWDAMDRWLEEDDERHTHVRDPYHRIDVLPSSRHVRVSLDGHLLAESHRPLALFESALPPRWYLSAEEVRSDVLEPCPDLRTGCAYKGFAEYHSVRLGDRVERALVWTYAEPSREVAPIAGRLCFFNERVDLELDGELQERPRTQWATDEWARQG
jgi:uncharacterized protein (DUF427 family)